MKRNDGEIKHSYKKKKLACKCIITYRAPTPRNGETVICVKHGITWVVSSPKRITRVAYAGITVTE